MHGKCISLLHTLIIQRGWYVNLLAWSLTFFHLNSKVPDFCTEFFCDICCEKYNLAESLKVLLPRPPTRPKFVTWMGRANFFLLVRQYLKTLFRICILRYRELRVQVHTEKKKNASSFSRALNLIESYHAWVTGRLFNQNGKTSEKESMKMGTFEKLLALE